MSGGILVDAAAMAGPGIGGGIGAVGAFRFIRWAVEFSAVRRDAREDRLKEREKALEQRYDARLAHLETELHRTRRALMLLVNETARSDARNPVLQRVAEILGTDDPNISGPISREPIIDDALDDLIEAADRADPDYVRPRRRGA